MLCRTRFYQVDAGSYNAGRARRSSTGSGGAGASVSSASRGNGLGRGAHSIVYRGSVMTAMAVSLSTIVCGESPGKHGAAPKRPSVFATCGTNFFTSRGVS